MKSKPSGRKPQAGNGSDSDGGPHQMFSEYLVSRACASKPYVISTLPAGESAMHSRLSVESGLRGWRVGTQPPRRTTSSVTRTWLETPSVHGGSTVPRIHMLVSAFHDRRRGCRVWQFAQRREGAGAGWARAEIDARS